MEIIETYEIIYSETDNAIMDIVAEQLQVDRKDISYKSNFMDDLGSDSLDVVELIMCFEELLDCEVPDEVAEEFETVKHVLDYCEEEGLAI